MSREGAWGSWKLDLCGDVLHEFAGVRLLQCFFEVGLYTEGTGKKKRCASWVTFMKESANYFQQEERFYFENLKSDDIIMIRDNIR